MKKLIALLLTVLMCTGVLPMHMALASEAEAEAENIALGKPVTASSTLSFYTVESVVDGDYKTNWGRSNLAPNEWVMVDLGEAYRITSVVLHPRIDIDDGNYRTRVVLEFSNTPDFSVKERVIAMGDEPTPFGEGVEVAPPSKTPYRYVRAVKTDTFIFVLGEFEVYGYIPDPNELNLGEDVPGSKQEGAISLLSHLGLMENVNEEIFGVDYLMTRAEAAEAVVKVFSDGVSFSATVPFADVDDTHKNYNGIVAAYYMNYITGGDNSLFRPDDYVTKMEFLLMTMRAMGYAHKYSSNTARMLSEVNNLRLLREVSTQDYSEPISRGDAAMVFYNALLAPSFQMMSVEGEMLRFEEGEDLLGRRYGITLTEGIVEETAITRLDGDAKKSKDAVSISGTEFVDPNGILDAYLGREVIVVCHEESNKIVALAWLTRKDEEVVIPAQSLVSVESDIRSGYILADYEGDEEKYKLSDKFFVICNGLANPYYDESDLMLKNGSLRLVDNDGDGTYDVVFAENYSVHYLAGVYSDQKEITIVDSAKNSKTVQKDSLTITNGSGSRMSANKLQKGVVVKLFDTKEGENCRMIIYNQPKAAEITEISDEEMGLDGKNYKLSMFYQDNIPSPAPAVGDLVNAYIDESDEILWIEEDSEAESKWVIAFSQAIDISEGLDSVIRFRMFNEKSSWVECTVADRLRVDGTWLEYSELAEMIKAARDAGSDLFEKNFLRYQLDADSKIKALDTTNAAAAEAGEPNFTKMDAKIEGGLYSQESAAFWLGHVMTAKAKNDTPTFLIPVVKIDNQYQYTADTAYNDFYSVTAVVGAAGNRSSKSAADLVIEQYMPDEFGYPSCFVKKQQYSIISSAKTLTKVQSDAAPFAVVEKVTSASFEDDEVLKIQGRNVSTQKAVTIMVKSDLEMIETGLLYQEKQSECLDQYKMVNLSGVQALTDAERTRYIKDVKEIGFGDIIRYDIQGSTARAVERVYDYNEAAMPEMSEPKDVWYAVNGNNSNYYVAYNRFQLGTLSEVTEETFTVNPLASNEETYRKELMPAILVCRISGNKSKIEIAEDLYEFADGNHGAIVYSYYATPKVAIIYDYAN